LDLFTRRVAAAPTTVTATAIEAAVSASAHRGNGGYSPPLQL